MSVATCVSRAIKPYPGLRPFRGDEADIFFGREEQIDQLLSKLGQTRFLSIIGESGCGKSSLVHAGLLPALTSGFLPAAGPAWRVIDLRPGDRPLRSLAAALLAHHLLPAQTELGEHAAAFVETQLRRGPRSLVELLAGAKIDTDANVLLFVDQFEEVFRFRASGASNDADAFVALLLGTTSQDPRVHVVLTMRSDFLGDCALFPGLPERLNDSQFLTPRLTRAQRQEAIEQPAYVFGGRVEPALTARLLNDMGSGPDRLPLMQHALLQLWNKALAARGEPATGDDEIQLTLRDYEQLGGLALALSNHADSIYHRLPPERQTVAETLFRALCQAGAGKRDLRRPERLGKAAQIAAAPLPSVVEVVERFRGSDCNFLMPPPPVPLGPETVLDISHESLIRQWRRLQEWAERESRSAAEYQFLELTARKWQSDQGSPLGKRTVQRLLHWRKTEKPNAAWAKRYGDDFELAMRFLDHSVVDQRRRRRNLLALVALFALLTVVILGLSVFSYFDRARLDETERETAENQGTQALEQGDVAGALARFAKPRRAEESVRQLRHGVGIRQLPKLVDYWSFTEPETLAGVTFGRADEPLLLFGADGAKAPAERGFVKLVDLDGNAAREGAAREGAAREGAAEPISSAAFLAGGAILSAGTAEQPSAVFRLWTSDAKGRLVSTALALPAGQNGAVLAVHPKRPEAVCMVHKTTAGADTVLVFVARVDAGRKSTEHHEIVQEAGTSANAAYSADGRGLLVAVKGAGAGRAAVSHERVTVYQVADEALKDALPERYRMLTGLEGPQSINHACLSPAADTVAMCHGDQLSERGHVTLWRRDGTQWRATNLTHPGGVSYAEFSPDGRKFVTACHDGYARVWTLTPLDKKSAGVLNHELKHGGSVTTANFSPDGLLLATGSRDKRIRVWAARTGALVLPVLNFHETVGTVRFHPSGFQLAALGKGTAQVWDLFTANPAARTLVCRGAVGGVTISTDGRSVALASQGGDVQLWTQPQGQPSKTEKLADSALAPHADAAGWDRALAAAIHPTDAKVVAVVQERSGPSPQTRLTLWQGEKLLTVPGATDGLLVRALGWSPDGMKLALVGLEATSAGAAAPKGAGRVLRFKGGSWDVEEVVPLALEHREEILSAQFDADSNLLVTGGVDDRALAWDLNADRDAGRLPPLPWRPFTHSADVVQASFGFNKRYLATASLDSTCVVWDLEKPGVKPVVLEHDAAVTAVRWIPLESPDLFVATACRDGVVRVWHVAPSASAPQPQRHLVAVFPTEGYIRDLVYVPRQRRLIACSTLSLGKRPGTETDTPAAPLSMAPAAPAPPTPARAAEPVLVTLHAWNIESEAVTRDHIDFLADAKDPKTWAKIRAAYHERYDEKDPLRHHDRLAKESEQQEQWHAAGWHLDRLLDQAPANPRATARLHSRRADVHLNSAAPGAALRHLEQALALAPQDAAELAEKQAKAYAVLKQWPAAVAAVERSGVARFWHRPEYKPDLDEIVQAQYDKKLHQQALALLDYRRGTEPGRLRDVLLQTAKNHAALGQWRPLHQLLETEYVAKSLYKAGRIEDFLLLRYAALAAFQLDDWPVFGRCAALLDTAYGGNRLSQPERRLVAAAAVLRDATGNDYLSFCGAMLKTLEQADGAISLEAMGAEDIGAVSQDAPAPRPPLGEGRADVVPPVAAAMAWTCLLAPLPSPSAEADRVIANAVRLAERANQSGKDAELRAVFGAALLRQALRHADVKKKQDGLRQALALLEQGGIPGLDDLFQALAHAALEQPDRARAAWERAEKWRRQRDPRYLDPALLGPLVDYFEFEVLRAEVLRQRKTGAF